MRFDQSVGGSGTSELGWSGPVWILTVPVIHIWSVPVIHIWSVPVIHIWSVPPPSHQIKTSSALQVSELLLSSQ